MADVPGTVSRILWHFTGGPAWNPSESRQNSTPKSAEAAYAALIGILESRTLKRGGYQEVVKVRVPTARVYNRETKKFRTRKNFLTSLHSESVCCLADIPVVHLSYQAKRYGKFAIGFHRDAAIRHGFNPVFYTLHETKVVRLMYDAFGEIEYLDGDSVREAAKQIEEDSSKAELDLWSPLSDIDRAADELETAVSSARTAIEQLLAFVKTFDRKEFGTIYCEREWRATRSFKFDYSDVAMIVLPKAVSTVSYLSPFLSGEVKRLRLPRSIPIVPWEDLVES